MSNIYNIKTPAEGQAASIRGDYGLDNLGSYQFTQGILESANGSFV